jgi:5'-deoxynucleotidase YfbR-like HD superfamily hydrolase
MPAVSNVADIRQVKASLSQTERRTERRTDMTKLIDSFCDYVKACNYFKKDSGETRYEEINWHKNEFNGVPEENVIYMFVNNEF